MYGTQTDPLNSALNPMFENDVKMYGTQTNGTSQHDVLKFENDVKMYGTQTAVETINR